MLKISPWVPVRGIQTHSDFLQHAVLSCYEIIINKKNDEIRKINFENDLLKRSSGVMQFRFLSAMDTVWNKGLHNLFQTVMCCGEFILCSTVPCFGTVLSMSFFSTVAGTRMHWKYHSLLQPVHQACLLEKTFYINVL